MIDIKQTIKAMVNGGEEGKGLWRAALQMLWKSYVALAVAVGVFACLLMLFCRDFLIPFLIFSREIGDARLVLSVMSVDYLLIAVLIASAVVVVTLSVQAHRTMKKYVNGFERKIFENASKNRLLVYNTTLAVGFVFVALLPSIVLFLSYWAAAQSGLMLDKVATPVWAMIAYPLCTIVAILFIDTLLTFIRMTFRQLTICFVLTLTAFSAHASQPLRRTIVAYDNNGVAIEVTKAGGPESSWMEASDGQRYVFDEDQRLQRLPAVVSERAKVHQRAGFNASSANGLGVYGVSGKGVVPSIGSPKIPVIMVAFKDLDFLPADDMQKISRFLNKESYAEESLAVGSVQDYFYLCSNGAFVPRFEVVAKVRVSQNHDYYGKHDGDAPDVKPISLISEAISLAEAQGVDFSRFAKDGKTPIISIIHAGPGEQEDYGTDSQNYIWAHFREYGIQAKTTNFQSYIITNETLRDLNANGSIKSETMTGIGTFCHEFCHALGLPDMYDTNHNIDGQGKTPGYWDLMDYQFMYNGYRPIALSGYERSMLGWMEVVDLTSSQVGNALTLVDIDNLLFNYDNAGSNSSSKVYRIANPKNDKEYFLLENRQKSAFYQTNYLGAGMLVWHVDYDETAWNDNSVNVNAAHQRLQVIPADGNWQDNKDLSLRDNAGQRYTFVGDIFPGYTNKRTFDNSLGNFYDGGFDGTVSNIEVNSSNYVVFNYSALSNIGFIEENPALNDTYYDISGRRLKNADAKRGAVIISHNKKIIK